MANNQTALAGTKGNAVKTVKSLAASPAMISRFQNVLGEKAPQFLASVVSATNSNYSLMNADPMTVMASAMVAATLDLDVIPGLGFAALVPYNNHGKRQCQFQIMTKGLVQLALRSGQYRNLNVGPIYDDEYDGQDFITGEVHYHEVKDGQRAQDDEQHIAGYFAYIELTNGFRKTEFWKMDKIIAHGKRYSKSFEKGPWHDNFQAMARKTVLKSALSHWGILSVKMTKAIISDQAVFHDAYQTDENPDYADNPDGMVVNGDGEIIEEGNAEEPVQDQRIAEQIPAPVQEQQQVAPKPAEPPQTQGKAPQARPEVSPAPVTPSKPAQQPQVRQANPAPAPQPKQPARTSSAYRTENEDVEQEIPFGDDPSYDDTVPPEDVDEYGWMGL